MWDSDLEPFSVVEAAACMCGLSPVPRPGMMPGLPSQGLVPPRLPQAAPTLGTFALTVGLCHRLTLLSGCCSLSVMP